MNLAAPYAIILFFVLSFHSSQASHSPIPFIENKGQWPDQYFFSAPIRQGDILFSRGNIRFVFFQHQEQKGNKTGDIVKRHTMEHTHGELPNVAHSYHVEFINSREGSIPVGSSVLDTKYNYYIGNDRSKWATNVQSYAALTYAELYPGIDLVYYEQDGKLKFDWRVKQGVDPRQIRTRFSGIDDMYLSDGNLILETSINEVTELQPYAYQMIGDIKKPIPCHYVLQGNELTYSFPSGYDPCYDLIIDPILIFSGYSGSTLDNWGNTATYDARGNVYSGGMVSGDPTKTGYPVTPGAFQVQHKGGVWDLGILKYDSSGARLLYCTYIGGNGAETPQSLVTDSDGNLLILGATSSTNFPVTNGSTFQGGVSIDPLGAVNYLGGTDLFVVKLSADGSQLMGGTYLGGSQNDGVNFIAGSIVNNATKQESPLARNYGDQLRGDIITDLANNVYLVSNTRSSDFPVVNTGTAYHGGSHDAVIVKLADDLSTILWSRLVGGNGTDAAYSIRLNQDQSELFVAGGTTSNTIAGMDGLQTLNQGNGDGWVMSLLTDGTPLHGTLLGTSQYDQAYFIDLNLDDEVFVYGQTKGNYPVTAGKYTNPNGGQFLHKLSNDLATSVFSTVWGSGGNQPNVSPTAFLVSECGYIYMGGWGGTTNQTTLFFQNGTSITRNYVGGSTFNLPVTSNGYQRTTSGNDFYFMVLNEDASDFLYGTFFGGAQSATHVDGGTSRFDKKGIVYHAVCGGCGGFSDFPAVNVPPERQTNRSTNCNNAVFKFDLSLLKARIQSNSEQLTDPGLTKVCIPDKFAFENFSTGGKIFEWDFGDGSPKVIKQDKSHVLHEYQQTGTYKVSLKAIDEGTCLGKDSTYLFVNVFNAENDIQDDDDLCLGSNYTLQASGGATYQWRSEDGSFLSNEQKPTVSPTDTTKYYIKITEASGCVQYDSVTLHVIVPIAPEFTFERITDCFSSPSISVKNETDSLRTGDTMFFDFGDGTTSDMPEAVHTYEKSDLYTVKLVAVREFCVTEKAIQLPFMKLKVPNVITPGLKDGKNDTFYIQYGEDTGKSPGDFGFKVNLKIFNRWGRSVYHSDDYQYDWTGSDLAPDIYYYEVEIDDHTTCKSWLEIVR